MRLSALYARSRAAGVLVTVLVLIGLAVMFYFGEQEPAVRISQDTIQIQTMYGFSINMNDVTAVNLLEQSMVEIGPGRRSNGYGGFGDTLKGYFDSPQGGRSILFVKANAAPTIQIRREGGEDVFISYRDGEQTRALYQKLIAALPNK